MSPSNGASRSEPFSVILSMGLMLLSVTALSIPSVAHWIHSPASNHEDALSMIVSVLLLALFLLFLPASLRRDGDDEAETPGSHEPPRWPVWTTT